MRFFFVVCGFGLAVAAINLFSTFIQPLGTQPGVSDIPVIFTTANRSIEQQINQSLPQIERVQTVASVSGPNRENDQCASPVFDVTFIASQDASPGSVERR